MVISQRLEQAARTRDLGEKEASRDANDNCQARRARQVQSHYPKYKQMRPVKSRIWKGKGKQSRLAPVVW
jgi:hypothetical protein